MTTTPQNDGVRSAAQDVAKLCPFRPPLIFLVSLVTGVLIHLAAPLPFVPVILAVPIGASLVVVAIVLFAYSVAKFRAVGTPVPARKPTTVIVRTGPYRFSRNRLIHYVVIPKEEQYLERRFGAEYLDYKGSVRRWL